MVSLRIKKRNEIEEKRKNDVIFKGIFFFTFPLHPMFEERIICTDWGFISLFNLCLRAGSTTVESDAIDKNQKGSNSYLSLFR